PTYGSGGGPSGTSAGGNAPAEKITVPNPGLVGNLSGRGQLPKDDETQAKIDDLTKKMSELKIQQARRPTGGFDGSCYRCGEPGHSSRYCESERILDTWRGYHVHIDNFEHDHHQFEPDGKVEEGFLKRLLPEGGSTQSDGEIPHVMEREAGIEEDVGEKAVLQVGPLHVDVREVQDCVECRMAALYGVKRGRLSGTDSEEKPVRKSARMVNGVEIEVPEFETVRVREDGSLERRKKKRNDWSGDDGSGGSDGHIAKRNQQGQEDVMPQLPPLLRTKPVILDKGKGPVLPDESEETVDTEIRPDSDVEMGVSSEENAAPAAQPRVKQKPGGTGGPEADEPTELPAEDVNMDQVPFWVDPRAPAPIKLFLKKEFSGKKTILPVKLNVKDWLHRTAVDITIADLLQWAPAIRAELMGAMKTIAARERRDLVRKVSQAILMMDDYLPTSSDADVEEEIEVLKRTRVAEMPDADRH
ncbi:hypothetical protein HK097_004887, partial [Rhizophlyctis rosea]